MSDIDLSKLSQLNAEQQSALNDDQKATYCMLAPSDQRFFAETFSPKDLPLALTRKSEILQRDQKNQERFQVIRAQLAQAAEATPPAAGEDTLQALAAAAGIGAAAVAVATDNTAHWAGVKPSDLAAPLEAEFGDKETTDINIENTSGSSEATIFLVSDGKYVPALTVFLTSAQDGVEVKMSDLTSQGMLSTIKDGGERLLSLARKGFLLWARRGRGAAPDMIDMAGSAFSDTTHIAELAGNLKIKDRAWKVIRDSANNIEKSYQDHLRQEREARAALEQAWDNYYNCPTCAVPFSETDSVCRVCGTARPTAPQRPDPRKL
jgi:hypothetical protein